MSINFIWHFTNLFSDLIFRFLTVRLLEQHHVATKLKSLLQKFYGRHHKLVDRYGVAISTMKTDLFNVSISLSSFVYPGLDIFISNSAGRKAEDAYFRCTCSVFSVFLVESELLIYFCYFVCIILFTSCSMLCLSVFPRLQYFDFR